MKKGTTNNPNGRTKGVPNKSTTMAREALARFVDNNTDKLEDWLVQIAAENPKDAFDCVIKVMEYHLPKLARTEGTIEHSVDDVLAGIMKDMDGRTAGLPQNNKTDTK